jgi:hypothetical protein
LDVAMQVLAALALRAEGPSRSPDLAPTTSGLATLLALPGATVADALERLRHEGRVGWEPPFPDEPGEEPAWWITDAGRAAVTTWAGRVVPLFSGWPPDRQDVDDAAESP